LGIRVFYLSTVDLGELLGFKKNKKTKKFGGLRAMMYVCDLDK
jgi:hypothetical protein